MEFKKTKILIFVPEYYVNLKKNTVGHRHLAECRKL
jgi:hypothetical protein